MVITLGIYTLIFSLEEKSSLLLNLTENPIDLISMICVYFIYSFILDLSLTNRINELSNIFFISIKTK